ncbi:Glutathione peroxidase 2 [Ceratocystis pirilliformis]|uniref:Glutathione peroxidase n=1 Tax=Ceratocystis pirilliformis TaxID=259994 RepID=A0ABR3YUS0_9PEZI
MTAETFYTFKPRDKKGIPYDFEQFKGKVVLVINTASKCGFTPQYAGLEKLYKSLRADYGDDIQFLGFPCNQFGSQEPGNDDEIQSFCQINYGVTFPILGKINVNGDNTDPFYSWLKDQKSGMLGLRRIKWNFEKFLIGRDGHVINRWASTAKPEALKEPILEALGVKASSGADSTAEGEADAKPKPDEPEPKSEDKAESKIDSAATPAGPDSQSKSNSTTSAAASKPEDTSSTAESNPETQA